MNLLFQIYDIISDDKPYKDYIKSDDGSLIEKDNKNGKLEITLYGKGREGENIICNVIGYQPYFYIKVPYPWYSLGSDLINNFLIEVLNWDWC